MTTKVDGAASATLSRPAPTVAGPAGLRTLAADAPRHEIAARFLAEHAATLYYGAVHDGPPSD
jgi:hypothetical protein